MDVFAVSFGVDSKWHSDVKLLSANINGADSHTKLQLLYLHSND